MKVLGYYSYILAALSVLFHMLDRSNSIEEPSVWPIVGLSAVFSIVGKMLTILADRRQQSERDSRAAKLFSTILENESIARYALYLRPFSTTGRLIAPNPQPRWLPILPGYFAHEKTLEFETLLSNALAPDLPLVALGRPGEHIGAGRLAVADDDWQAVFHRMIRDATWIVMIPSHEGETRWEIEQLVTQDYLGKTVFVMPPMLRSQKLDVAEYWKGVREGLQPFSIQLPKYTGSGQLFRLSRVGKFYRGRYLPKLKAHLVRDRFYGLTTRLPKR